MFQRERARVQGSRPQKAVFSDVARRFRAMFLKNPLKSDRFLRVPALRRPAEHRAQGVEGHQGDEALLPTSPKALGRSRGLLFERERGKSARLGPVQPRRSPFEVISDVVLASRATQKHLREPLAVRSMAWRCSATQHADLVRNLRKASTLESYKRLKTVQNIFQKTFKIIPETKNVEESTLKSPIRNTLASLAKSMEHDGFGP